MKLGFKVGYDYEYHAQIVLLSFFIKETVAKAMNSTSSDVTFNPMMYRHELTEAEAKKHSDFEKLVNSRQSVRTTYQSLVLHSL